MQRCITVAKAADIVVIDWELGNEEGEEKAARSKAVIKGILEGDIDDRGRLRLIAIYTAETTLGTLLDQLFDYVSDLKFPFGKLTKSERNSSISNKHLKIIFANKPGLAEYAPQSTVIEFGKLPEFLIKEFSELNEGLLPSVALESIAAIRNTTHHLLAVLHSGLDGTLVSHRCLLPHPDDAEDFCLDLVADELRAVLANNNIGSAHAGKTAHKRWIGAQCNGQIFSYGKFHLSRKDAFDLVKDKQNHKGFVGTIKFDWLERKLAEDPEFKDFDGKLIDLDSAKKQIINGDISFAKKCGIPDVSEMSIPNFYYDQEESANKANLEFSRLCSLRREAFGIRRPISGWLPLLTLGSILCRTEDGKDDSFFICLQPKCDSVRLKKGETHSFPFLPLIKKKGKFNCIILIMDNTGSFTEKELHYEAKPRNLLIFQFHCSNNHSIEAIFENGKYVFTDVYGKPFEWIADVKDLVAQRIADELSSQAGRVGLDEYEWLRRKAR